MSISVDDIYNKMTEFLYCHDDMRTTLDVCLGTVIAQRFDIENCWLMVVGPPSSGKSLMLQALTDSIKVMFMDDMSNSSLISGYRDEKYEQAHGGAKKSTSIAKMLNKKVLVVKDMTRLLDKGSTSQFILNQLRVLYDGVYRGGYGNDNIVTIYTKFNILGACTNAIDTLTASSVSLGERFLYFRLKDLTREEEVAIGKLAIEGTKTFRKNEEEWTKMVVNFVDKGRFSCPAIPSGFVDRLVKLGRFIAKMRAQQSRDWRGSILAPPADETPTRATKQLLSLCLGIAAANRQKEIGDYEMDIVSRVALGSMPEMRRRLISLFWNHHRYNELASSGPVSKAMIAATLKSVSDAPTARVIDDLYASGLIEKCRVDDGVDKWGWVCSKKFKELVIDAGVEDILLSVYDNQ